MTSEKQPAHDLNTSEGGRKFIADYFRLELHRHDFADYITTHLAADFACALAQHLAARQSEQQIADAEIDFRLNALYREMVDSGQHNGGMSGVAWDRAVFRMASKQSAKAADLGIQQDAARWRAIAPHLSVEWDEDEMLKRWTWIDFKGDALSVPTRTRESYASVDEAMDAVIDNQAARGG